MGMEGEAGDNDLINFRKDPEPRREGGAGNMAQTWNDVALPARRRPSLGDTAGGDTVSSLQPKPATSAQGQKEGTPRLPRDLFHHHWWRVVTLYTATPFFLFRTRRGEDLALHVKG